MRAYLTRQVLWCKAVQGGFDRMALAALPDATLPDAKGRAIELYLEHELERRLPATSQQIERYYREHIRAFTQPNRARVRYVRCGTWREAQQLVEQAVAHGHLDGAIGGQAVETVADDWGLVQGLGGFPTATDRLFRARAGQVLPEAVKRGQFYYVFEVLEFLPANNPPFSDVRAGVATAFKNWRRAELKPRIIAEAMRDCDAELYPRPRR